MQDQVRNPLRNKAYLQSWRSDQRSIEHIQLNADPVALFTDLSTQLLPMAQGIRNGTQQSLTIQN